MSWVTPCRALEYCLGTEHTCFSDVKLMETQAKRVTQR